jgi:hypothetical protein
LSISNINTKGPLNQTQRSQLKTAREVKQNVLKTTKRFQGLDETPADLAKDKKDVVIVTNDQNADLPQSLGNKVARLAVGILAPKEEEAKVSGTTVAKDGQLETANVVTQSPDGTETEFKYRKLDDGSEIYHGPTSDGYAVVRENKDGTLMMMTSDKPANAAYWDASSWEAPAEQAVAVEEKPTKTFADTLKDLAGGQQATGPGTLAGRVKAEEQPAEAPPTVEAKPVEAEVAEAKQSGFMAPFGEVADKVKQGGEQLVKDMGETVKDTSDKVGETSKGLTDSLKDWSQSSAGQSVGNLLFGIANPWRKKG